MLRRNEALCKIKSPRTSMLPSSALTNRLLVLITRHSCGYRRSGASYIDLDAGPAWRDVEDRFSPAIFATPELVSPPSPVPTRSCSWS